jgi:hypothetical protein
MIMLVCLALLFPLAWIGGGSPMRIADVRLRAGRFAIAGLAVQIAILETPLGRASHAWLAAVHVGSYLLIGVFLWRNARVPGFIVLGAGAVANFAAIAANDGVMPSTRSAARIAGLAHSGAAFSNSAVGTKSPLWFLGDVFAIPHGVPFANVFSAGDVAILVGAAIFLWRASRLPAAAAPDDPESSRAERVRASSA